MEPLTPPPPPEELSRSVALLRSACPAGGASGCGAGPCDEACEPAGGAASPLGGTSSAGAGCGAGSA
eukprot:scaffold59_cov119-Isochrysis_galbana.AAC.6